ncbi:TPA: hypothetical protein ACMDPH_003433 [Vibrio cholerae]
MMQYLDQRIDALKKQLANEAPEVKAINEPAYRFAIRELELAKSALNKSKSVTSYDDDYIDALEKQVQTLVHHLQLVCFDVEALPSHQDIYGVGAKDMIERIEALYETAKAAEKVIGEHFELMNGFKGD